MTVNILNHLLNSLREEENSFAGIEYKRIQDFVEHPQLSNYSCQQIFEIVEMVNPYLFSCKKLEHLYYSTSKQTRGVQLNLGAVYKELVEIGILSY